MRERTASAIKSGVNVICGALLHDTVEDPETTEDELLALSGGPLEAIFDEVYTSRL